MVLGAQAPLSNALFIIQHQTCKLWMKLALHDIGSAICSVRARSNWLLRFQATISGQFRRHHRFPQPCSGYAGRHKQERAL